MVYVRIPGEQIHEHSIIHVVSGVPEPFRVELSLQHR